MPPHGQPAPIERTITCMNYCKTLLVCDVPWKPMVLLWDLCGDVIQSECCDSIRCCVPLLFQKNHSTLITIERSYAFFAPDSCTAAVPTIPLPPIAMDRSKLFPHCQSIHSSPKNPRRPSIGSGSRGAGRPSSPAESDCRIRARSAWQ